uniref:Uncharacterized protein n=1 Tax=Anguilla anguilla TaxID=7936 RepID=A0A0E9S2B8_ANGAN
MTAKQIHLLHVAWFRS